MSSSTMTRGEVVVATFSETSSHDRLRVQVNVGRIDNNTGSEKVGAPSVLNRGQTVSCN
jgi:hypothetical protein